MSKPWSNLAKVVYKRTYSRIDNGIQESWKDTIKRVIEGNTKDFNVSQEEKDRLYYYLYNRKATPAGRGLWFSGSPAQDRIGGKALNNCWMVTSDNWKNFVVAQDLLMLGGGVGLSVEHRFVSKLPKTKQNVVVSHKNTKDADFIVPDSREGWCELVYRVLESFFETGKSFTYSTICIRSYGEIIKGFGGVSSGPGPLITCIDKIFNILNNRQGKHIRPIDAMDILCSIGEMVVAGNIRRSAILILGDSFDKEYLKAKRWDLGPIPTERAMANLSVVVDDIEDLHPLFWKTYEQGEPFGIVNRKNIQKYGRMGEKKKDTAIGVNPCFTGDTLLLTDTGKVSMRDLCGVSNLKGININGEAVPLKVWSNGIKPIIGLVLSNSEIIKCTEDHIFLTSNLEEVTARNSLNKSLCTFFKNNIKVVDIVHLGEDEVFDFNLDDSTHWGVVGSGIIAHNCAEATLEDKEACNLQEIYLPNLKDKEEFIEAARLMHRWGKRVSCAEYYNDEINKVIRRNRRIGTGITGCLQAPNLFTKEILDEVYQAIQEENVSYSKELGIEESIRTTVVKPSGTLSIIGDVTSGIHPAFSKYYIRRVRFSSSDPLIPILKEAGHSMYPVKRFDGTLDHGTLVVDFYMKVEDGVPTAASFTTQQQLDVLLFAQKHWADQAVSVTVYYKKEEIQQIKDWLKSNLKNIKTISFLCYNDHGFEQAPLEAITEEQYNELSSKVKDIDISVINSSDVIDSMECEGGYCPIK